MNKDLVLIINKPKGITSNQVIQKIKKNTNIKKIGHGGTLDPAASGVLVIGINKGTKLLHQHLNNDKVYIADIKFGIQTSSYDLETPIILIKKMDVSLDDLINILNQLKNEYDQLPPIYSALKINGKKAYEYARNNQEIKLTSRKVKLYNYKILSFKDNILKIELNVSKGFYVRSLANDLGKLLNGCATLINLVRIRSGDYSIKHALTIDNAIALLNNDNFNHS